LRYIDAVLLRIRHFPKQKTAAHHKTNAEATKTIDSCHIILDQEKSAQKGTRAKLEPHKLKSLKNTIRTKKTEIETIKRSAFKVFNLSQLWSRPVCRRIKTKKATL